MTVVEFAAVEHFAHALASPGAFDVVADIEARTEAMTRAVDRVIDRFAATPELMASASEKRLKVVEGLIAMISQGIDAYAEVIRADEAQRPVVLTDAVIEAHDAMVADYYRLLGLRAELCAKPGDAGEILETPEQLSDWFDKALSA